MKKTLAEIQREDMAFNGDERLMFLKNVAEMDEEAEVDSTAALDSGATVLKMNHKLRDLATEKCIW